VNTRKIQITAFLAAAFLGVMPTAGSLWAQGPEQEAQINHDYGESITGALEGWFANPDGTNTILVGYYNRNLKKEMDVPVGPNNHLDPGGPDMGQPTHFMPGRQWGMFKVIVPKDFGTKKIIWTLVVNGKTTTIPLDLKDEWMIKPMIDALNNTPPYLSFKPFAQSAPTAQGPMSVVENRSAQVGEPLSITAYVADDNVVGPGRARPPDPPVTLVWTKFRGPGTVKFEPARPKAEKADDKLLTKTIWAGKATTTATFSEPGDYMLNLTVNDGSGDGGGGFQCCWTTSKVKVSVK
jgi:hypothetical protein